LCSETLDANLIGLAKVAYEIYLNAWKEEVSKKENILIAGRSKFLELMHGFSGRKIHFKDSGTVLGETFTSLIIDLTEGFQPNDLGILIETVEEGGIIIALSPPVDEWKRKISKWHEELISEPYTPESVVPRFYRRFIDHSLRMNGIIIYDADSNKLLKKFKPSSPPESKELHFPSGKHIKRKLYKLCATQDQISVLKRFETFFDRKTEKKVAVITADRGRGKTAVLGILTPFLISRMQRVLKRPIRIMIVAQTLQSIQTYFRFLKIALKRQGFDGFKVKESDGMVTVITGRHLRVEYVVPRRALIDRDYADIIIVDEAASIDVSTLLKIVEGVRYAIFSTTIHGYEGSGRSFSVRFLKRLEKDERVEVEKIDLEEPVRYGKGDPVEEWLYRVLLLNAQPAHIDEEDIESIKSGELRFEMLDKDEFMKDEKLLAEFFGIYVLAHYRNRPSDLVILSDMPNHIPFRVEVNGKTICSLHVAVEGNLADDIIVRMVDGYKPKGQIVPDVILKHHWEMEFPKRSGVRVVRIATHPDLMDMGIGSYALGMLVKWAENNNFDWVGSGFGISPELLRFWQKNGFVPVHITPQRNEISGEFTVVVLKPLNDELANLTLSFNSNFVKRVVEYLCDELRDLETEIAIGLLKSLKRDAVKGKYYFSEIDRARIEKYFQGISLYEYVSDIARPLVRCHYLRTERAELEDEEEYVLVRKCLQMKNWWELGENFKGGRAYGILQSAIKKIWMWFINSNKTEGDEDV